MEILSWLCPFLLLKNIQNIISHICYPYFFPCWNVKTWFVYYINSCFYQTTILYTYMHTYSTHLLCLYIIKHRHDCIRTTSQIPCQTERSSCNCYFVMNWFEISQGSDSIAGIRTGLENPPLWYWGYSTVSGMLYLDQITMIIKSQWLDVAIWVESPS